MRDRKPKIVFFGTPEISVDIADTLVRAGYPFTVVVTAPDRPVGRKQILTSPKMKEWAAEHGIPVLQPKKLNQESQEQIKEYGGDLGIVVAYGMIMPKSLIDIPPHGTLNVHYSLLPKYRGASPTEAALLFGDTITGVTIQKMVPKLDAGPIIAQREVSIEPDEKKPELQKKLNGVAASLLIETLPAWIAGKIEPIPQDDSQASFCKTIQKSEGEVDLTADSPEKLWNMYRAFHGWPGIFFFTQSGKRIKITEASYENGAFIIKKVIPEGKQEMSYDTFLQSS